MNGFERDGSAALGSGSPKERLASFRSFDTRDVEEAVRMGQVVIGKHTLAVADRSKFHARVNSARVAEVGVLYTTYGTEVEVVGAPLNHFVGVLLPVSGSMVLRCQGRATVCSAGSAVIIPHHLAVRMSWEPNFAAIGLSLGIDAISRQLSRYLRTPSNELPEFVSGLASPALAGTLKGTAELLAAAVEATGGQLLPTIARDFRDLLITGLLVGHDHSYRAAVASPSPAPSPSHLIAAAADHIRHDPVDCGSVGEIAAGFGLSVRSLQYGFRHNYGCSPGEFRRLVQLEYAREDLVSGEGADVTVSAIAYKWGFSNPGRFAREYRDRYDEYPSTSLSCGGGAPR